MPDRLIRRNPARRFAEAARPEGQPLRLTVGCTPKIRSQSTIRMRFWAPSRDLTVHLIADIDVVQHRPVAIFAQGITRDRIASSTERSGVCGHNLRENRGGRPRRAKAIASVYGVWRCQQCKTKTPTWTGVRCAAARVDSEPNGRSLSSWRLAAGSWRLAKPSITPSNARVCRSVVDLLTNQHSVRRGAVDEAVQLAGCERVSCAGQCSHRATPALHAG